MRTIHRASFSGGTRCGTPGPISCSGVFVTCERCVELSREPTREEQLRALQESIERLRLSRAQEAVGK